MMETIKKILAWIGGIGTFIIALFAIFKSQSNPKQLSEENEKILLTNRIRSDMLETDIKKLNQEQKDLEDSFKKESNNVKSETNEELSNFFNNRNKL